MRGLSLSVALSPLIAALPVLAGHIVLRDGGTRLNSGHCYAAGSVVNISPIVMIDSAGGCGCWDKSDSHPTPKQLCPPPTTGTSTGLAACHRNLTDMSTWCTVECLTPQIAQDGACVDPPPAPEPAQPEPCCCGLNDVEKPCPAHLALPIAQSGAGCACAAPGSSKETACAGPTSGHGIGACRENAARTSSECYIKCDTGYTLQDGQCISDAIEKTLSIEECAQDPPGHFLSAVPGEGCKCLPAQTEHWCDPGKTTNGVGGSCYQSADFKEVYCTPASCDSGFKPSNDRCVLEIVTKTTFLSSCTAATGGYNLNPQPDGCKCETRGLRTSCCTR
ncbi:hypothetical protein BOTBODRAFT_232630 [Botryobasidium botryosum FD-172 SS1]|uniref:Uncharacterized protein n=1 Tax=Botryobasidium botryosum (strain FD-172 SS1) TaxID=930990 RepID=A0A067LUV5_BOTB1|nr:hypothetical protein BOTBODRAFT_232630 [Botryobasidium botryosum FD-172 SS1]